MTSVLGFLLMVSICIQASWAGDNCYSKKADIVFIMDESSSINLQPFKDQKKFITDLIDNFDIRPDGTQIGLVSFATNPRPRFDLKTFKEKSRMVQEVLEIRQKGGNTHTWLALDLARERSFSKRAGSRSDDPGIPQIAIIITDGNSQQPKLTKQAAQELRDIGVTIFAIGVGPEMLISQEELLNLAGSDGDVFRVQSYDKLKDIEHSVLNAACVTVEPPTLPPTTTTTTTTTLPPTTLPPINILRDCVDKKADVLFVMDTSENAMPEEVDGMKDFLGNLVYSLDIGADKTRVGLITYSTTANLEFGFDQYDNYGQIYRGIMDVQASLGPSANLMEALKMANNQNFNPDNGGRTKIAKALVLITTGKSSDSTQSILMARQLMADRGVKIIAIAVASASRVELGSVAGASDVIEVANLNGLPAVRDQVAAKICRSRPPPNDFGCGEYRGIDFAFVMNTQTAGGDDMEYASEFMRRVSSKFEIGPDEVQVSVVPAECKTLPGFQLNRYGTKEELLSGMTMGQEYSLGSLMTQVTTSTFTSANGARPKEDVNRIIVIVTDGNPDQASQNQAAQAKADGIEVYVVGVGKKVNSKALAQMASEPAATHVFAVRSYEALVSSPQVVDGITASICQRTIRVTISL